MFDQHGVGAHEYHTKPLPLHLTATNHPSASTQPTIHNFGSWPTPNIALEIARYGTGLVIDHLNLKHYLATIRAAVGPFKTRITKYINSRSDFRDAIPAHDRQAAYARFDRALKDCFRNIHAAAVRNKRRNHANKNLTNTRLDAMKQFLRSPLQIIACDKNYGLEVARSVDVRENCLRILEQSHYRTETRSAKAIQLDIHRRILRCMNTIQDSYPGWRISERKGYLRSYHALIKRIRQRKFERFCDLAPLHKIHKKVFGWRAILRLHLHPSNWIQGCYNRDMQAMLAAVEQVHGYRLALENSAQLLRYLDAARAAATEPGVVLIQRAADLTKMYDHLQLSDVQNGIAWLCAEVRAEPDVQAALLKIVALVYDTTYIRSYGKVVQLKQVTAMGWIISPVNAIVALLRVEHESRTSWLSELLISAKYPEMPVNDVSGHADFLNSDLGRLLLRTSTPSPSPSPSPSDDGRPLLCDPFDTTTSTTAISRILSSSSTLIDGRYIDDVYQLLRVQTRTLQRGDLQWLLQCLRADKGQRYKAAFEGRMQLTVEMGRVINFLDITIEIDPLTQHIQTRLFEKRGKCNNLLHADSNSAPAHFSGLYAGAMFRFVTLNTHELQYKKCKAAFVVKLMQRGYDERQMRHLQRKCRVKWDNKDAYLNSLRIKLKSKKHAAIIDNLFLFTSPRFVFANDLNLLRHLLSNKRNNAKNARRCFFFCKVFNRFFDDDDRLRGVLANLIDDLGLLQVDVMISNRIHVKLGSIVMS